MGGAGWVCWLVGARDERRGVVCGEGWPGVAVYTVAAYIRGVGIEVGRGSRPSGRVAPACRLASHRKRVHPGMW